MHLHYSIFLLQTCVVVVVVVVVVVGVIVDRHIKNKYLISRQPNTGVLFIKLYGNNDDINFPIVIFSVLFGNISVSPVCVMFV